MTHAPDLVRPVARLGAASVVSTLLLASACSTADLPSEPAESRPNDPVATPTSLSRRPLFSSGSTAAGIPFASFDLDNELLGAPYRASVRLPGPTDITKLLPNVRARGGQVMVMLSNHDSHVQNSDRTFNLEKWKEQVARFKDVNLQPFIADGTLIGFLLIDEPDDPSNWGGQKIPPSTVEEMARYSKQLWPGMTTFVRSKPVYLGSTGIKFKYLDAGWAMYQSWQGDVSSWVKTQVAAAKEAGIGLIVGLNVLNGGTEASGIKGTKGNFYAMSPSQLRSWGTILMNEPYACGFFNWRYDSRYNALPDIQEAMTALAQMAESHPKTPCRQSALSTDLPIVTDTTAASVDTATTPTDTATTPVDTAKTPIDTTKAPIDTLKTPIDTAKAPVDSGPTPNEPPGGVVLPGGTNARNIPFASFDMDNAFLGAPYNGAVRLPAPGDVTRLLNGARAKGGRIVLQLTGHNPSVQGSNRTFSLEKWKRQIDRFKSLNLSSYINDGTLMGHILITKPEGASTWGGKRIPQSTLEAMAQYSKQLWPALPTFVHSEPTYLRASGTNFRYLDAGWIMYGASKGDVRGWLRGQVAAAKASGLGLVVGLNVLDGGTKASGIQGRNKGKYAMSATELRSWGSTLLDESYVCGFFNWRYDSKYNARTDIRSAMSYLSQRAKSHAKTSCQ
jgi:hypothetical protein